MSSLSTHALDTATGKPAEGLPLMLEKQPDINAWKTYSQQRFLGEDKMEPGWETLASGKTNSDGRCPGLLPEGTALEPGLYRMSFDTATYFEKTAVTGFYPQVQVAFEIHAEDEHYHVPLLISPFGFSTYRGS